MRSANALSRQITFTKAGSVATASVPTLGTLGLVLLAGLMGVAAYRNRRVRGALNVLLPVIAIAALSLGSAPSLNAQATDPNTTYAGSVNDAIQWVRAVVDAAGNVRVIGTRAVTCQTSIPPTVPANIPTQVNTPQSSIKSLDLAPYMQAGWTIESVSVENPGAANGVGPPQATVAGTVITLSLPLFYGNYSSIATVWRFRNVAGVSANFSIAFLNMGS
jgi:IPTL-CTERM motif